MPVNKLICTSRPSNPVMLFLLFVNLIWDIPSAIAVGTTASAAPTTRITPSPTIPALMQTTTSLSTTAEPDVEEVTYKVNMSASFIRELDELDEYMINITSIGFHPVCKQINVSLAFCGTINYPIPKSLSEAPYFQDNMARTAVDALSILTKGATTKCERQLKTIYCQQKFPQCFEYKQTLQWHPNQTQQCFHSIDECPDGAREVLKKMLLCEKLSKGEFRVDECVVPMPPSNNDLCSHGNVSAWLYHSSVEINSLLQYQFALNENLSGHCKGNLTSFLCSTGQQCFREKNTEVYLGDTKTQCEDTVNSCEGEELSMAMKDLFLKCEKYQ